MKAKPSMIHKKLVGGMIAAGLIFYAFTAYLIYVAFQLTGQYLEQQSSPKTILTERLNKQVYEHIRIYYTEKEDAFVDLTIEAIEQAKKRTASVFQFDTDKPLDIIYFDDKETIEQYAGIKHITGFYSDHDQMIGLYPDKREALLKKETLPLYFFNTLLIHEYAHFVFYEKVHSYEVSPVIFPLWFHEGTAEWTAYDVLNATSERFDVIPFQSLHSDQDWQDSRMTYETDVYVQSYYMIYELVQLYGRDIIHEIMQETAKTGLFAKGFEQATGQRLADFEDYFHKIYQRKNG
ncbi:hypothetical protein [Bacillus pumilus]|uniref:Peptidase MA-like domain-containing protein n=1 Tax=Bacillus pumilus (strain SAFR-032) TaxID=315750 RepID=A8FBD4_BACP2|nr:hypothetical protein [Bacillus pumilus]ABV61551.2 hypothetical protein BPUM_0867 [Bacillus pumilus SAFR-032]MBC3642270.1 hypothetical protein [Bacillus pumilus]MBC3647503.1 hypothetical protein [Bacillus pumilus]MBC3651567.1 hypothetical protein [Bacillus pumilus]MBC3653101.1 hypothetical protein [Bacillus pumilus]